MKILLLTQFFSTTKGGGEHIFSLIAKEMVKNDHKVWVLTNKILGEEYIAHKNLKIIFVPPDLDYKGGLPPTFSENFNYFINTVKKGMEIIKKEKIDIIHSNNFAPAFGGAILSFFTLKPHITSIWDIFTLCGKDFWKLWVEQKNVSKIHGFLGPRFEKLILKVPCKAIHTISNSTRDDLKKFGAKKPIHIIFPSIEYEDFLNNKQDSFQFIYIGRLVFYKNLEVLIKAIQIVKKTEPKIKLKIVGGGPHENIIKKQILELGLEANIELTGYLNAKEKLSILSQSNALLFPSFCEGFGLVILEAFSQNKPAIVSDVRPMSDIVSHNETGYILDPNNEEIWAQKMLELSKNPELSLKMGNAGRKNLEENYNIKKMYEKIIQMYENYV